jgi:hypothetical protein
LTMPTEPQINELSALRRSENIVIRRVMSNEIDSTAISGAAHRAGRARGAAMTR